MNKYGRVTAELKALPEDEPIFVLRGKDLLAPIAVEMYASLLRARAAGADEVQIDAGTEVDGMRQMARDVSDVAARMLAWQAANPDRARLPD